MGKTQHTQRITAKKVKKLLDINLTLDQYKVLEKGGELFLTLDLKKLGIYDINLIPKNDPENGNWGIYDKDLRLFKINISTEDIEVYSNSNFMSKNITGTFKLPDLTPFFTEFEIS